ncbi:MAG: Gfo/Idh/MocA family oxidoreductase [Elusimicrobiota bacterium]
MDKKLKLAFIGCGYMGQTAHIANYVNLPNVEIVGLSDLRVATAEEVSRKYSIPKVYPSHKEMLESSGAEAIVAIMGFALHHGLVPDVLSAGKHCLTEKPIAITKESGEKLVNLATTKNVVYQIAYMKRSDPGSVFTKKKIGDWKTSGEAGKFNYLRVSMPPGDWTMGARVLVNQKDKPVGKNVFNPETYPSWMDETMGKRYVAFVNYYIHQVNMIRYLLGEDYTVKYVDPKGMVMLGESVSGITIVLEMATYNTGTGVWNEFYSAQFDNGKIDLSLPAPMAKLPAGNVRVFINNPTGNGAVTLPVVSQKWSMAEQARYFVDSVLNGTPCISPAVDAVKDLDVAEQVVKLIYK